MRAQYPAIAESNPRFYALTTAIYKKMGGAVDGGAHAEKAMLLLRAVRAADALGGHPAAAPTRPHKYIKKEPDKRGGWRYFYATSTKLDRAPDPGTGGWQAAAHSIADHHTAVARHHESRAAEHKAWMGRTGAPGTGGAAPALGEAAHAHKVAGAVWRHAASAPEAAGAAERATNAAERRSDDAERVHAAERAEHGQMALPGTAAGAKPPKRAPTPPPPSGEREDVEPWLKKVTSDASIAHAAAYMEKARPTSEVHAGEVGGYTPARAALHQKIVRDMLNPLAATPARARPAAVFLMGPPGAGKTSTGAPMIHSMGRQFTTVNSDAVKEALPEYRGFNAGEVHEESSHVAERVLQRAALVARHNIIFDLTGANGAKVKKMLDELHGRGYDAHLLLVDLPAEKAAARAVDRFYREGRYVPPGYVVHQVDAKPQATFKDLKSHPAVVSARRYNNDVPRGTPAKLEEEHHREAPRGGGRREEGAVAGKSALFLFARRGVRAHGGASERQHPRDAARDARGA